MLSFHVKFVQTDRQTDGWTTVRQYAPDHSILGHKNDINSNQSIESTGVAFVMEANEKLRISNK